jgi:hypothetical protein
MFGFVQRRFANSCHIALKIIIVRVVFIPFDKIEDENASPEP